MPATALPGTDFPLAPAPVEDKRLGAGATR